MSRIIQDDMQLDQQAYTMHGVSSDEHVALDCLTATGQLRLVHTLATGCGMLHRFRRRSVTLHIRMREREREFIFHIATTLEQVHNRNAKLGGLPERHLAHQSWPPIVTIYCKYTLTKLYSQCRRTASGVNEPLVNSACTTARISNISKADRFAVFHRYLSSIGLRYDTIQNTILTCARKLT